MINPDSRPATRLLWPSRMKWRILEKNGITVIQIDEAALERGFASQEVRASFLPGLGRCIPSGSQTAASSTPPRSTLTCATPTSMTLSIRSLTWMPM
uniref:Uncharacterized protein n=1 Tax=Salix viminalis TaxID=40686 RepID=A0A6N2KQX6_SALVM